jgi:outer membrane protein OmpA-like peptidoglycan-associated protein
LDNTPTPLSALIVAGNTFAARGIQFDTDKATLRPESYLQLHAILAELKRKPELKVEISGHTDSTGTAAHNMELSRARAKVVADYLITEGIDKSRITWKGYGYTKPLGNDAALNRRVEMKFY